MRLVEMLVDLGEHHEATTVIYEAPNTFPDEVTLQRAFELTEQRVKPEWWRQKLVAFLQNGNESARSHAILCRLYLHGHQLEVAKRHYDEAVRLDDSFRQRSLEHQLGWGKEAITKQLTSGEVANEPSIDGEKRRAAKSPPCQVRRGSKGESASIPGLMLATVAKRDLSADGEEAAPASRIWNDRNISISAAAIIHLILFIWIANLVVSRPAEPVSRVTAVAPAVIDEIEPFKRQERRPDAPEQAAALPSYASQSASPVSQLEAQTDAVFDTAIDIPTTTSTGLAGFTLGADFGSMNFAGGGKESVRFFGSSGAGDRVVFVVDVSGSMLQRDRGSKVDRFELMLTELRSTLTSLPRTTKYQVIFFAGPAWFAGDSPEPSLWKQADGPGLFQFRGGDDSKLPFRELKVASPSNIRETLEALNEVRTLFGTDWRAPLKMAMNLEPQEIFFLTDGVMSHQGKIDSFIAELVAYGQKKGRPRINTICLMAFDAMKPLQELAEKTRGEASLVLGDGETLRGLALDQFLREKR